MQTSLLSSDKYFGGRRIQIEDRLSSTNGKFYPYGEDKPGNPASDTWKFATYWRDSQTNLDYADQRYFSSQYGRFTSPDPYKASAGSSNPKSWNRYSYVEGDPVNYYDPSGLSAIAPEFDPGVWGFDDVPFWIPGGGGGGGCTLDGLSMPCYIVNSFGPGAVIVGGLGGIACVGSGVCEVLVIGGATVTAFVLIYNIVKAIDTDDVQTKKTWPPCTPYPVGTIGYREDTVPPGRAHYPFSGDHVHLYKVNQNPLNGKCFWQGIAVTAPPPPPGAVPMVPLFP